MLGSEDKVFFYPVLVLLLEPGVEAVLDEALVVALVVAHWRRLEGLFEDSSSPVVGDEDGRFVVDHLLLHALDLAPAVLMLVLVYLHRLEALV